MVAHTCNTSSQKIEPRRSWVQSQAELHSEILPSKIKCSLKRTNKSAFLLSLTVRRNEVPLKKKIAQLQNLFLLLWGKCLNSKNSTFRSNVSIWLSKERYGITSYQILITNINYTWLNLQIQHMPKLYVKACSLVSSTS